MKIVLMGYMASGKSAIGKILAQKLNLQFIDLDDFIEENEKLTIAEIFKKEVTYFFIVIKFNDKNRDTFKVSRF